MLAALTCLPLPPQTLFMAQTYLLFDFADEEKVQQARHKLEGWKQAFRLDKKLQYKLEREGSDESGEADVKAEANSAAPEKSKSSKSKSKSKSSKSKSDEADAASENNGPVKLMVRLYFSGHEKLSEQRWIDRIPVEEPFKGAFPKIVREDEPGFAETIKQFEALE